jgi:hypothetical protein
MESKQPIPACPWCKAVPVPHPSDILADEYMIIRHAPDCYLALDGVLTAMDQEAVTAWCALCKQRAQDIQEYESGEGYDPDFMIPA